MESGRWVDYLALARFDIGTIEQYRSLHLSIFNPDENVGKFTILLDTGDLEQIASRDPLRAPLFFKHITLTKPGWQDLRFDLRRDFSTLTNPTREEIQGVGIMMIPPSKPKTIYVDDVKFEK